MPRAAFHSIPDSTHDKGVPKGAPLSFTITTTGPRGEALTFTVPRTAAGIEELQSQREELSDQDHCRRNDGPSPATWRSGSQ